MPVERREQVIAFESGSTGNGKNPVFKWKAAAFARWHEPDDARVSSPESVRGSGCNSPGLLGIPDPKRSLPGFNRNHERCRIREALPEKSGSC